MSLSSTQLDAFMAVAKYRSFSKAANSLFISQPALSQRVINLENFLGSTLIIRGPQQIKLTELGYQLLRYCLQKTSLENEFLQSVSLKNQKTLFGMIRVAGYSTITKSILIPLFANMLKEHPNLQLDLKSLEFTQMLPALESGEVDYVLTGQPIERKDICLIKVGEEHNALVESKHHQVADNVFLDHDENDVTTLNFIKQQPNPPSEWSRHYLDNIELIIEGVKSGIGRAVIPLHLIKNETDLTVVKGANVVLSPIYLAYYDKVYESSLDKYLRTHLQNLTL